MIKDNVILLSDSYKYSHFNQYPEGTEAIYSYMEARGGEYDKIVFFGLQYYIQKYLMNRITKEDIDEADALSKSHGIPFNSQGWQDLLNYRSGYFPLEIHAVPEGSINKPGDVLMTITNTDSRFFWLTNWIETLLMKVWYPTTVATKSYAVRQMLLKFWEETSDDITGMEFAYHNFGDRGSSSVESAMIGGMAHLTQFSGSDNFNAVQGCKDYYGQSYGFSIPASEHSTITSWGKDGEFKFIDNYLETYKSSPVIACVLDSYNIYDAVNYVTSGNIKDKIESDAYPIFVIRPDSGNPLEVVNRIIHIMKNNGVKFTINSKGYKVFDKYRIIWGDGVTPNTIKEILGTFCYDFVLDNILPNFSASNFAFGSGGDLMQNVNRDTCKFAIKCSAVRINGEWRDVFKNPITDSSKKSQRGLVTNPAMNTVYDNFPIGGFDKFSAVRIRSK